MQNAGFTICFQTNRIINFDENYFWKEIMSHHEIIEMFSPPWWRFLFFTGIVAAAFILLGKKNPALKTRIRIFAGVALISVAVLLHIYLAYLGKWQLQTSLPLQLCSMSGVLSGIVLLWRNQIMYELILYWGIPGAFYSLLTPEMTQGSGRLFIYEYYISHGGIIFSALYLSIVFQMSPRKHSWLKIFLYSQFLLPVVGLADYILNANYMYLREKPEVENPFIIGEWPWYILGLEAAMLLHFYLVYLPFYFRKNKPEG